MPMEPMGQLAASADRQALVPMAAGYLILMSALALGLRRLYRPPAAQPGSRQPAGSSPAASGPPGSRRDSGWAAQARHVTGTVVAGYLLLMAVVVAYYYAVARVGPGFLQSAVTGTALLVGLAAPVFAAASWLAEQLRRRRGRPTSHPPAAGDLLPRREASTAPHPLIGYLAWAVLFGALFAWEGLALARVTGVPSLSDVVRVIMRYPAGRWALFALWLWAGWRVFVRRWQFLLRA
jgi:Family of unknown function (DUF6256)/Family of unknown function (DUF6186)